MRCDTKFCQYNGVEGLLVFIIVIKALWKETAFVCDQEFGFVSTHRKICWKNTRNSRKIKRFYFTVVRTEHFQFIAICVNDLSSNFNKTSTL